MMFDPTTIAFADNPYRTAASPDAAGPDATRLPYTGETRLRLTIGSGLANARVVIDPAATDLIAVDCGDGPRPRLRLSGGELSLAWRRELGDWLRDMFAPSGDDIAIVLHPAVEWTVMVRRGAACVDFDLAAGTIARLEIGGGCSQVLFDLPAATSAVPVRIHGGASRLTVRRPGDNGVSLSVAGGTSMLRLDALCLDAIGGVAHLDTGNVARDVPHYDLSISGGACELAIEPR